ncbi:nitric oxide reductase activation protein NorD [Phosphitispora fastidiosa]|uniref:nitric oxide reductase activation protein NorD n=1 Tax=Phosphitispora fastidiosa TaxID=2837202 RepID=UPI001E4F21FC|nr:hypothetical protein [Phosphitispora fastidiosa]MBU7007138.1 hypothetical protein [Phosphitispora fastidiosa]
MVWVGNAEINDSMLKSLKDDERESLMEYLTGLPEERVGLIIKTGEVFHKSSTVNGIWFWRIVPEVGREVPADVFEVWLKEGLRISRGEWECALSFLKASPEVAGRTGPDVFADWTGVGRELLRYSSREANWYFKNSEYILGLLNEEKQRLLIKWTSQIIVKSWQAAVAALKVWPEIAGALDMEEMAQLLKTGYRLAGELPDDAGEFFLAAPMFIRHAGIDHLDRWAEAAYLLKECRRGVTGKYFAASPAVAETAKKAPGLTGLFEKWALLGRRAALADSRAGEAFFEVTPQALKNLSWDELEAWVDLILQVSTDHSGAGACDFILNTPELLQQLDAGELADWVRYGLETIEQDKRLAYFALKSQESRDAVSRLRSGLFLEAIRKVLLIYFEGLTGEQVIIRNTSDLPGKIHEDDRLFGTLDTRRIYLPDMLRSYDEERENLRLYRVMLMHLTSHRTFGTLDLTPEEMWELAQNRKLGQLFEYIEDNRVDYLAMQHYPGLSRDMGIVTDKNNVADSAGYLDLEKLLVTPEVKADMEGFRENVVENGASAAESLSLARRMLLVLETQQLDYLIDGPKNHIFRGRLRYDLIYTSMKLDAEIGGQASPANEIVPDLPGEFYPKLKKLLQKYHEDEENPYRMTAYYDEWDRTLNDYKKDWCRVREIVLKPSTGRFVTRALEEHRGMINTLKRYFGMLRPDRVQKYGRREDGEDIDIDAVIEAMVEIKAGVAPETGFYIRRDKRERDVAVGFLLDLSYSTEEVISQTGKTLLDVETESVVVMAEALEVLGDKYAIYGFNSDSRDKVNFYVVKDFEEPYTVEVKQRYGGLKSYGMTRLAAATRHAVSKMQEVRSAIKILIILSDGRPFDFDYTSGMTKDYEPLYPESDTRMALREAKMKGVNPFCITVDTKGQEYMDFIFGNVNYIIIDDVNALPTKLTETYKNLTT